VYKGSWLRTFRVVVVLFGVLLLQACQEDLYSGLDERQANQMISELSKHGVQAGRKAAKNGSLTITVEEDKFAAAVQVLEASGLPEAHFASLGDVFKSNGLVSSPTQERAQFVYAMSQELSNTVSQMDGIRTARVHVDLPENETRRGSNKQASAAVFVRYTPDVDIESMIPKIKSLVAGSISGLDYEHVSVIPVAARPDDATDAVKMTAWMGILIPAESSARLTYLMLFIVVLVAALASGSTWWGLKRSSKGVRTYRQSS